MISRTLSVLAATAVGATPGVVQPAQASTNGDRRSLVVYDNNIENMAGCDGNYSRFISYLKKQKTSPDVFTVQQISNTKQLNALTERLSDALPGTYAGVIAVHNPGSMGYTSGCAVKKNQQTNAVIYRTGRLHVEAVSRWRSLAPYGKIGGPCQELKGSSKISQDRVVNVAVRFRDEVAQKDVSVASIHWPTGYWYGPECAAQNMRATNAVMDKLGGTVKIVAGDANATKGAAGWWDKARSTYRFHDAVWDTTCKKKSCPDSTSTSGHRRIDFLLVKGGHGFSNVATVASSAAGGRYSGHRAVRAYVTY